MSNAIKAQNWADEESSDEELGPSTTKSKPRIDHTLTQVQQEGSLQTEGSITSRRQDRPHREHREGDRAPRSEYYANRRSTGENRGSNRTDRDRPDSHRRYEGGHFEGRGGGRHGGYREDNRGHSNFDDKRLDDREHLDGDYKRMDRSGRSSRHSVQPKPISDSPSNSSEPTTPTVPTERPKLVLLPRTVPPEMVINDPVSTNSKIFGEAKPRDEKAYVEKKKEVEKTPAVSEDQAPSTPAPSPTIENTSIIASTTEKHSRRSDGVSGRGECSSRVESIGRGEGSGRKEGSIRGDGRDGRGEGRSDGRGRSRGEGWVGGRGEGRKSEGGPRRKVENSGTVAFSNTERLERRPPRVAFSSNGDFGRGRGGRARGDRLPVEMDANVEQPPVVGLDVAEGDLVNVDVEVVKAGEGTANPDGNEVEASTVDSVDYLTAEPSPAASVDGVTNSESLDKDNEVPARGDPRGVRKEKLVKGKGGDKVGRRDRDQAAAAAGVPNTLFQKSVAALNPIVKNTVITETSMQTPVIAHKPLTDAEKFRKAQEEFAAKQHSDLNPAAKTATSKVQKNAFIALMDDDDEDEDD